MTIAISYLAERERLHCTFVHGDQHGRPYDPEIIAAGESILAETAKQMQSANLFGVREKYNYPAQLLLTAKCSRQEYAKLTKEISDCFKNNQHTKTMLRSIAFDADAKPKTLSANISENFFARIINNLFCRA